MTVPTHRSNARAWAYALILVLGVTFLVFPLWYFPAGDRLKLLTANALLIDLLVIWRILRWVLSLPDNAETGAPQHLVLERPLVVVFVLVTLFHIIPLRYPIVTYSDQHLMAGAPAALLDAIREKLPSFLSVYLAAPLFFLFLIPVALLARRCLARFPRFPGALSLLLLFLFCNLYFLSCIRWRLHEHYPAFLLFRYSPLLTVIPTVFFSLFHIGNVQASVQGLVFHLAALLYLYNLIRLFRGSFTAFVATALFAVLPPIFYYAHQPHSPSGCIFFLVASAYYLLRYLDTLRTSDCLSLAFFLICGFLYKNEAIAGILGVAAFGMLYGLRQLIRRAPGSHRLLVHGFCLILLLVLTIGAYGSMFALVPQTIPYRLVLPHYVSAHHLLFPWREFLRDSFPGLGWLFAAGLVYELAYRRDRLCCLFLIVFSSYYFFNVGAGNYTTTRFSLPGYVFIALCIGDLLSRLLSVVSSNRFVMGSAATAAFVAALLGVSVEGLSPFTLKYYNIAKYEYSSGIIEQHVYLPYDQLFQYIRDHCPPGAAIFAPMICEPSRFYISQYDLGQRVQYVRKYEGDRELNDRFSARQMDSLTMDRFVRFLRDGRFQYVVTPATVHARYAFGSPVAEKLIRGTGEHFALLKRFSFYDADLLLYAIR